MTQPVVFSDKDTFGCNFLKSFLNHVEFYQTAQEIVYTKNRVKFGFDNENAQYAVFDYFELNNNQNCQFTDTNILIIETLFQLRELVGTNKLDSSKKYYILSESWWDCEQYQFGFDYKLFYVPWDIIDYQNRATFKDNIYHHLIDLDMLDKYDPKYDFLCLIGIRKDWRDDFVHKLTKIDLSNTLTSYYGKYLGHPDLLELDIPYDRSGKFEDFEKKFYNNILHSELKHKYNLSYFLSMKLFYSCKFSLIAETIAVDDEYHVTEKTLKCLILGHPFVVMGSYKFLDFLHKLGFKTYDSLFDESYDNTKSVDARMYAVIHLADKLRTESFDVEKLKEIQNHNINALFRLRFTNTYINFLGAFNNE